MSDGVQRRREKKARSSRDSEPSAAAARGPRNPNSEAALLARRINRLDKAKHGVNFFVKIILCAVVVGRGYSIFTKVSRRRWGGATAGWRSAFQFKNKMDGVTISIPQELLQPFGAYPNIFNVSDEIRSQFYPVIKFPLRENLNNNEATCLPTGRKLIEVYDYIIKDHTGKVDNSVTVGGKKLPQLLTTREEAVEHAKLFPNPIKGYDVGRYDEDRSGMYTSSLFGDSNNMRRTVHVGIDIGAPVGTEVHAFEDGIVQSVGYNSAVGDYGHVIVVEHTLSSSTKVYALYGHLAKSVLKNKVGDRITKGQVIGHIGNTDENGGWTGTHLHFQVAVNPPKEEHDMPGAVTLADRSTALLEYVDPRYFLGELH